MRRKKVTKQVFLAPSPQPSPYKGEGASPLVERGIAVVILNWNAAEDTIACVQSLRGWSSVVPKIWVVDNASADDSVVQIRDACPEIRLICSDENLGFAGGSNLGIQAALQEGALPILLLNNDAMITEEAVAHMLGLLAEDAQMGAIVPLLYDEATGKMVSAGGKNPVKHMQTRVREVAGSDSVLRVEVVSGTAVLISPALFAKVGLFDERFFFSTEMADLCLRGARAGFTFGVDLQAGASHSVARSSRFRDTLYVYYIIRNRFLILRNHYRWNVLLWGFWGVYSLALAAKLRLTGKRPSARAVFMALKDGLTGRFGGQNGRVMATVEG